MSEGTVINYRVRLRGWPMHWQSLIRDWRPPFEFSDEQLRGPYRFWLHRHIYEETAGGTVVRDHVRYALPFAPFGELVHPLVRAELRRIFAFRKSAMQRLFPAGGPTSPSSSGNL